MPHLRQFGPGQEVPAEVQETGVLHSVATLRGWLPLLSSVGRQPAVPQSEEEPPRPARSYRAAAGNACYSVPLLPVQGYVVIQSPGCRVPARWWELPDQI